MIKNIFFIILLFFLNFSSAFAVDYLYDDFTSKDTNKWSFYPNGGNIEIIDNNLFLSSNSNYFPYLINKNTNLFVQTGDTSSINIKFRHDNYGPMGNGISIGFTGVDGSFFEQFQIWRDERKGSFLAYHDLNTEYYNLCSEIGSTNPPTPIIYTSLGLDNQWHFLKIEKVNDKYRVYIDPDLNTEPVFITQDNQCSPKHILLGNIYTGGGSSWNDLFIDNINIGFTPPGIIQSKIIIIPGFGASWNSDAIVYNDTVDDNKWKMTPFVKNYNGLINALKQNNLEENKDFYVWNYDWRKPVNEIVNKLNDFIDQNVKSDEKVVLVGHSLGGLTARIWAEDNNDDSRLKKVITLGSPHLGAVDAYEAWNGGQISDLSKVSSIAFKILLEIKGLTKKTNMETVRFYIPSVKDLLPTFDFTKKNGVVLNNSQLETKNNYLENKNNESDNSEIDLKLFSGSGFKTKNSINLKNNNIFDKILGVWPDGRINNFSYTDSGDGTVLTKSANYNRNDFVEMNSDHGEIVDKTVNQVMMEIGLSQVDIASESENLKNNLVVFVGSPAKYSVKCDNDSPVLENDGFVVIKNKNYKLCSIDLIGTGDGLVHIVIGNTNENNWSYWEKDIENKEIISIKIDPKNGQIINDKDNILFLKSIIRRDINLLIDSNQNNKLLKEALKFLENDQPRLIIKNIFGFREISEEIEISQKIINNAVEWLSLIDKCSKKEASNGYKIVKNYRDLIEGLISNKKNLKVDVNMAIDYQEIEELLEINEKKLNKNNYQRVCANNFIIINYGNRILKKSYGNGAKKWLLEDSDL